MGDNTMMIVLKLILISMVTLVLVRAVCDPDIPSRPMPDRPVSSPSSSEGTVSCTAGHYRDNATNTCKACPDGTFMTAKMSKMNFMSCDRCMKPIPNTETVVTPCTPVRDARIMCVSGYYRQEVGENSCYWDCKLCQLCGLSNDLGLNYVGRPCGGYNDAVCCLHDNMMVVNNTCVEDPELSTSSTTTTTDAKAAVTHSASMLITLCLMTISIPMMLNVS